MKTVSTSPATPRTSEERDALLAKLLADNAFLRQEIAQLKRLIFGAKTERFVPAPQPVEQTRLEGLDEQLPAVGFTETTEKISYERRKPRPGHGRNPVPDDIHCEEIIIEPTVQEKTCTCGKEKTCIGYDETTELEYRPAVFFARKYRRAKYACPDCPEKGVSTGLLPTRPIERGVAGTGLLSWIIVSKYVDHLPLYRLEQIFKRYGIHINRSSMVGWISQVCTYLKAIYEELYAMVLQSVYVQADETPIKVLDDGSKGKTHVGYLYPYIGEGRVAVFDFRAGRGREGPTQFLADFTGQYLLTDDYAGYHEVVKVKNLVHLLCWAHARRKFFEAKDTEPQFAANVLNLIGALYAVESRAKDEKMSPEQRHALRQRESQPVLQKIRSLLDNPGKVILPRSPMGEAIHYAVSNWAGLNRYLLDGRLPIDNNLAENTIRPVALGRKNWLFAGSDEGGRRMAVVYSLMATCKLHDVEPFAYLNDVLGRIADYPRNKVRDLTPMHWKMSKNA